MRLRERDVAGIKAAAAETFDGDVVIRLFGSRLDDSRRGGDIDLHITGDASELDRVKQGQFRVLLQRYVGERAIDTVFSTRGSPVSPIDAVALREGIIL